LKDLPFIRTKGMCGLKSLKNLIISDIDLHGFENADFNFFHSSIIPGGLSFF